MLKYRISGIYCSSTFKYLSICEYWSRRYGIKQVHTHHIYIYIYLHRERESWDKNKLILKTKQKNWLTYFAYNVLLSAVVPLLTRTCHFSISRPLPSPLRQLVGRLMVHAGLGRSPEPHQWLGGGGTCLWIPPWVELFMSKVHLVS